MTSKHEGNWLEEDPEWKELRRRVEGQKPAKIAPLPKKAPSPSTTEALVAKKKRKNIKVSLDISVPKLPKFPRFTQMQLRLGAIVGTVVVIGVIGILVLGSKGRNSGQEGSGVLGGSVQEPEFDTVLPDGKKEEVVSGKVGYDPSKKVASFQDTIGPVNITVSQQALPENFKAQPDDEVKKLAESFSANEVITESNPKAYVGTSVKGPQTVIFHKNNLLVFIQSDRSVDKSEWAAYITRLL